MNSIIAIENLCFTYEEAHEQVLKNVTIQIEKGQWVAIIGHNGSGKSTLAKFLNGLLIPDEGDVLVSGYNSREKSAVWDIRKRVGLVFQNPDNQLVATTVRDDIAFGLENNGVPREEMDRRIEDSLRKVKMEKYVDAEPSRLSGGQKQRIAIAGILAIQPEIMVLDEATSMLDPVGRREVIETVQYLNQEEGITVISITHDLAEAALADHIIVMANGEVRMEGSPKEIFQMEEELVAIGLEVPFIVQLKQQLKQLGLSLPDDIILEDELVDALWTLKSKT